jgi:hypothetical protein
MTTPLSLGMIGYGFMEGALQRLDPGRARFFPEMAHRSVEPVATDDARLDAGTLRESDRSEE